MSGKSAIDDCIERNAAYAAGLAATGLTPPPVRQLAVVSCMDARLDVHALLGLRLGDAHVIRNAGGVATDDVIRSLVISQRLLGTREVMLIHHSECGLLTVTDAELKDAIEAETGVRPPFAFDTFADLERNVRQSIARIRSSPFVPHRDAVRGFVYDVQTGRLREVV